MIRQIGQFIGKSIYLTGATASGDPAFEGFLLRANGGCHLWRAIPTPQGYLISIGNDELQGSTFNLALEVAEAFNRCNSKTALS